MHACLLTRSGQLKIKVLHSTPVCRHVNQWDVPDRLGGRQGCEGVRVQGAGKGLAWRPPATVPPRAMLGFETPFACALQWQSLTGFRH